MTLRLPERRDESEEDAGEDGGRACEDEDVPVQTDVCDTGCVGGKNEGESAEASVGDSEASDASEDADEDTFDEKLRDDALCGCAERAADGHFALA